MNASRRRQTVVVRIENFENDALDTVLRSLGWEVIEQDEQMLPVGVEIIINYVGEQQLYFLIRRDGLSGPRIIKDDEIDTRLDPIAQVLPFAAQVVDLITAELE